MIYLHDNIDLYINLFVPSELKWKEKGITLIQTTDFPYSEKSVVKIQLEKPKEFALHIRCPQWVKEGSFSVTINGKEQEIVRNSSPYIKISRKWSNDDLISINFPMKTYVEYLPDHSHWTSFIKGPIVLAAATDSSNLIGLWADDSRWGHKSSGKLYPIEETPMVVSSSDDLTLNMHAIPGKLLSYNLDIRSYKGIESRIEIKPFFEIYESRYIIYWPVVTPQGVEIKKAEIEHKEKQMQALDANTIDKVLPGDQQSELSHNFKGENTNWGIHQSRCWRDAYGWFSYDLTDKMKEGRILRITYFGPDEDREFQILINGTLHSNVKLNGKRTDSFFDEDYIIPQNIINNSKGVLNIKFVAKNGKLAGGVFYIRLLKEN
jgi:hypothetical protein